MSKPVCLYRVAFETQKNNVHRWKYIDLAAFNMAEAKQRAQTLWYDIRDNVMYGNAPHMFHIKVSRITPEEIHLPMNEFHQEEWVSSVGAYYQKISPEKREIIAKYWA